MERVLRYRDQLMVNFRDHFVGVAHGFRWVDVKRFNLHKPPMDDLLLLQELLEHIQFRDDYAGGGVGASVIKHGPYRLDRFNPQAYEPVDSATMLSIFAEWADQFGRLPPTLIEALESTVYPLIRLATSRYVLTGLGASDLHDWGTIHTEFHEFVTIDRVARTLALVVAADD